MCKPYKLAYYSATAMEVTCLGQAITSLREEGGAVEVHARTQTQLFDDHRIRSFVGHCMSSDVVIVTLHGGRASFPGFDALEESLNRAADAGQRLPLVHIQPVGGDEEAVEAAQSLSTRFGTPEWDRMSGYLNHGGAVNYWNLLCFLSDFFNDTQWSSPPLALPFEGIYHPDFTDIPDIETYREKMIKPGGITVGIWFNQAYWVNHNLVFIDFLIRAAEERGANVIPVFHRRYRDENLGKQRGRLCGGEVFHGQRHTCN